MIDIDHETGQPIVRYPKCHGLMDWVEWIKGIGKSCGWRRGPDGADRCPGLLKDGKTRHQTR